MLPEPADMGTTTHPVDAVTLTTWRHADASAICSEWAFTTTPEFFFEHSWSTLVVEEHWTLVERRTRWLPAPTCTVCDTLVPAPDGWDGHALLFCGDDCRSAWEGPC